MDGKSLYLVLNNFTKIQKLDTMLLPRDSLRLCCLVDVNKDQSLDIIYTKKTSDGGLVHEAWSVKQNQLLFSIPGTTELKDETAYTVIDIDYNDHVDLVTIGNKLSGEGQITIYDINTKKILTYCSFPAPFSNRCFAILQNQELHETYFTLATDDSLLPEGSDTSQIQQKIYAYVIFKDQPEFLEMWSKPIRPGLLPSRVSIGKTINEEDFVVLGTRLNPKSTNVLPRAVTELSLPDGEVQHELVLDTTDCIDLSVENLDDDPETEIVFFDSQQNLHRLDFSQNRNRVMEVKSGILYVGSGTMYRDCYPENPTIQQVGAKLYFNLLNQDLDPHATGFSLKASLFGRPILGDTDGNGRAEMIFITNDNSPRIHRLSFFDPDVMPKVADWKNYEK